MSHIVVIGAGVIGLTTAVALQQAGHRITIIAKDFPTPFETTDPKAQINYTSPWAGAHNRFCPPKPQSHHGNSTPSSAAVAEERDHAMSLTTYSRMEDLAHRHPEAGITFVKGIEYFEDPGPEHRQLMPQRAAELGYRDFRLLRPDEMPDDRVKLGFEYSTWCVNTMVYCSFLLRKFTLAGGKTVRRELRDEREAFGVGFQGKKEETPTVRTVINCSGFGFGDKASFITRGQTCVVANHCPATVTRQNADGTWSFCVPRFFDGGTIVGGTKEPDNWDTEPSGDVRIELLRKFAATYPQILDETGEFKVLRDIVGRRPTRRGGLRLEREELDDGRAVVHGYGVGGRGFELSWGVAEAVVGLVRDPKAKARL